MQTRVTEMLGIEIPIVQAPMGWIARSQLASAVSIAGGLGIIETSSGQLDVIKDEIAAMRELTDKPWGVNVAQLFIRDLDGLIEFLLENKVGFVTTSAGDPAVVAPTLKEAGVTVFHVVPTIRGAEKGGVEGFLKGLGQGAVGLVVKPLAGLADGVSSAAEGIKNTTDVSHRQAVFALRKPAGDFWKYASAMASTTPMARLLGSKSRATLPRAH